ncbi:gliding motility-associated peptidyl-prolyl isomerase GldI [Flavobacterium sp. AG291]|uniref:gliding motility-associated peptidyl-prolyl isomerase GldI n=1 Tax=Flavobacterium sp. AG291 TaxID=2184000 RepID=UPI000E0BA893|nr:gliding motility-associated peptidyl-prolyl isomerase GldI [Flavobacterium sp. AG291]RDI06958.1 protein involved in gliding motility GldI [Flavobacterium sp. AG291]
MKKLFILPVFLLGIMITSCSQQQARRPVSHSSGTFMKESVERNKKLIANEESEIDSIIKSNPAIKYIASDKGYWYHYEMENTTDSIRPKRGDVAYFDYEIKDMKGNIIYSQAELKPQVYYVDKQNIMMGLRDGIKLMNEGEKITFLFPSHMGYGYHGDNNKIGTNQPLMCTVTLNDIRPESQVKEN